MRQFHDENAYIQLEPQFDQIPMKDQFFLPQTPAEFGVRDIEPDDDPRNNFLRA